MEQLNTEENNILIAEFMGANLITEGNTNVGKLDNLPLPNSNTRTCWLPEHCGYDHDWNWLMPVVEKITQQTEKFKEGHIDSCLYTPLASALIRFTDKELVYEAVVEFIKFYNMHEQKQ